MRSSLLAAVLSLFIPGLGQLYKGHFIVALLWFLAAGFCASFLYWLIFPPIIIWILCVIHAFFEDSAP